MSSKVTLLLLAALSANAALMQSEGRATPKQPPLVKPALPAAASVPAQKSNAGPSLSLSTLKAMEKGSAPQQAEAAPKKEHAGLAVPASDDADSDLAYGDMSASLSRDQLKRKAAFEALVNGAFPMSPDMIKQYHRMMDMTQQAVASTPNPPPTPLASTQHVRLDPGATPPVIRLSAGFVSSVVFLDSTGQPWPIENYSIGDPGTFNIQWDKETNTLFIQGQKHYSHGNMAVRLAGENTPVMISLVSGQRDVDYRVDMMVDGRGPNALAPIISTNTPGSANPLLVNILDGIPPESSLKLAMDKAYGQAFMVANRMYLRTKKTIISPAWSAKVTSPDGMHVYELAPTPMVLVSDDGQTHSLHIRGF